MASYIYILASKKYGTLYTGVTTDLVKRIWEHKEGIIEGFTKRYGIKTLVYYEVFDDINNAIKREKEIKGWLRVKKIQLIENVNKSWLDLYGEIIK